VTPFGRHADRGTDAIRFDLLVRALARKTHRRKVGHENLRGSPQPQADTPATNVVSQYHQSVTVAPADMSTVGTNGT